MAGEEPRKMPKLYVEALLEEHGLCKRPQAAMRSKSRCVRNLLPKSPKLASELHWELELPEDIETWMQAHEHLRSTMDEWECAYEALLWRRRKLFMHSSCWIARESCFERIKELWNPFKTVTWLHKRRY